MRRLVSPLWPSAPALSLVLLSSPKQWKEQFRRKLKAAMGSATQNTRSKIPALLLYLYSASFTGDTAVRLACGQ